MDGILGYTSLPRQQLLALDPNIYGGEPFRHGLTPPQLSNEQMHSYGKGGDWGRNIFYLNLREMAAFFQPSDFLVFCENMLGWSLPAKGLLAVFGHKLVLTFKLKCSFVLSLTSDLTSICRTALAVDSRSFSPQTQRPCSMTWTVMEALATSETAS